MGFRLKNKQLVQKYLLQQRLLIEKALIYRLEFLIAELQNHAKENAEYEDQTSNLKSSIGGVLLKDGKPVSYSGFTGKAEGRAEGNDFVNSLLSNYSSGYVILIVAGMQYATYVEDIYNRNVLKKTELEMQRQLPLIMQKLKMSI